MSPTKRSVTDLLVLIAVLTSKQMHVDWQRFLSTPPHRGVNEWCIHTMGMGAWLTQHSVKHLNKGQSKPTTKSIITWLLLKVQAKLRAPSSQAWGHSLSLTHTHTHTKTPGHMHDCGQGPATQHHLHMFLPRCPSQPGYAPVTTVI